VRLRGVLEAATHGPWRATRVQMRADDPDSRTILGCRPNQDWEPVVAELPDSGVERMSQNAALIVAAVNALPYLLDVVEAAALVAFGDHPNERDSLRAKLRSFSEWEAGQ
jgi:hypothetical protein